MAAGGVQAERHPGRPPSSQVETGQRRDQIGEHFRPRREQRPPGDEQRQLRGSAGSKRDTQGEGSPSQAGEPVDQPGLERHEGSFVAGDVQEREQVEHVTGRRTEVQLQTAASRLDAQHERRGARREAAAAGDHLAGQSQPGEVRAGRQLRVELARATLAAALAAGQPCPEAQVGRCLGGAQRREQRRVDRQALGGEQRGGTVHPSRLGQLGSGHLHGPADRQARGRHRQLDRRTGRGQLAPAVDDLWPRARLQAGQRRAEAGREPVARVELAGEPGHQRSHSPTPINVSSPSTGPFWISRPSVVTRLTRCRNWRRVGSSRAIRSATGSVASPGISIRSSRT